MSDIRKAINSVLTDTHTADSTKTAYEIIENALVEVVEREIEQLQKENADLEVAYELTRMNFTNYADDTHIDLCRLREENKELKLANDLLNATIQKSMCF